MRSVPVALLLAVLFAAAAPAHAQVTPGVSTSRDAASVDRLLDDARRAAREDRNRESAELFARVIAADPARRPALLMEYGDQLSYSGRAREAAPLFREALDRATTAGDATARHRARLGLALSLSWSGELRASLAEYRTLVASDGNDREARLGLARVLAWRDQLVAATREYDVLLARDPRDFEARRERMRVTSWRGRNRTAIAQLRALRTEYPADAQTALILASAYDWTGRPALALALLDSALVRSPGNDDLVDRRAELLRSTARTMAVSNEHSRQSDDLDITTTRYTLHRPLARGQAGIDVHVGHDAYRPLGGRTLNQFDYGLSTRVRRTAGFEWNAIAYVSQLDPAGQPARTLGRGDTWLTLWPSDFVRIDVGANRAFLDNVRSLEQSIAVTSGSASVDLQPTNWAKFSVRTRAGLLSDDNSYQQEQFEASIRPTNRPTTWLGARVTAVGYSHVSQNGYFSPTRFVSAMATAHVTGVVARIDYDIDGAYGKEWSTPYGDKPAGSANGRLGWPHDGRLQLAVIGRTFSSKLSSSSGFSRTTLGAELRARW